MSWIICLLAAVCDHAAVSVSHLLLPNMRPAGCLLRCIHSLLLVHVQLRVCHVAAAVSCYHVIPYMGVSTHEEHDYYHQDFLSSSVHDYHRDFLSSLVSVSIRQPLLKGSSTQLQALLDLTRYCCGTRCVMHAFRVLVGGSHSNRRRTRC